MIGIIDSGLGGLSVALPLAAALPRVSIIYLADQAYAPYGERTQVEIQERLRQVTRWFVGRGASLIVLACNTATVNAIDALRAEFTDLTFVGMEPAMKPAALAVDRILVIGTNSTVQNARYQALVDAHASGKTVWHVGAPELVRQVEAGELDRTDQLEARIQPYINQGIEGLVIGCSHFTFLVPAIARRWPIVRIFDGAEGVVRRIVAILQQEPACVMRGTREYWTTGQARTISFVQPSINFAHAVL